jgi:hypothetical protein
MPEEINQDRRRFVGAAMMTMAAARFGMNSISKTMIGETLAGERIMLRRRVVPPLIH